jgi:hypothetical protein
MPAASHPARTSPSVPSQCGRGRLGRCGQTRDPKDGPFCRPMPTLSTSRPGKTRPTSHSRNGLEMNGIRPPCRFPKLARSCRRRQKPPAGCLARRRQP